jgi:hypothetical protein
MPQTDTGNSFLSQTCVNRLRAEVITHFCPSFLSLVTKFAEFSTFEAADYLENFNG